MKYLINHNNTYLVKGTLNNQDFDGQTKPFEFNERQKKSLEGLEGFTFEPIIEPISPQLIEIISILSGYSNQTIIDDPTNPRFTRWVNKATKILNLFSSPALSQKV